MQIVNIYIYIVLCNSKWLFSNMQLSLGPACAACPDSPCMAQVVYLDHKMKQVDHLSNLR